jgi:hypothetical protein
LQETKTITIKIGSRYFPILLLKATILSLILLPEISTIALFHYPNKILFIQRQITFENNPSS